MPAGLTVLLVGGTGRTGRCVMRRLLDRRVDVRAIVRSKARVLPGVDTNARLTLVEGDLPSMPDESLLTYVRGCDAVISCLGHVISMAGIFGPPRDLVSRTTSRLCRFIRELQPSSPVTFILMSSVSVNHPLLREERRTTFERGVLSLLRVLVPPARDNQRAADFLCRSVGPSDRFVRWVVVRPDTLVDSGDSPYTLHEQLVDGLFKPGRTNIANVADFMCGLTTDARLCDRWAGRLPVILNDSTP
ncbi:MAG: NAD(P)-binding oxidoreductase [Vicinamibacterales bacterium]